jgi:hypothetical protein
VYSSTTPQNQADCDSASNEGADGRGASSTAAIALRQMGQLAELEFWMRCAQPRHSATWPHGRSTTSTPWPKHTTHSLSVLAASAPTHLSAGIAQGSHLASGAVACVEALRHCDVQHAGTVPAGRIEGHTHLRKCPWALPSALMLVGQKPAAGARRARPPAPPARSGSPRRWGEDWLPRCGRVRCLCTCTCSDHHA